MPMAVPRTLWCESDGDGDDGDDGGEKIVMK
jgi:hypothetical protein